MSVERENREDFSAPEESKRILDELREHPPVKPVRIMNVCGSHERAVAHLGLRKALGKQVLVDARAVSRPTKHLGLDLHAHHWLPRIMASAPQGCPL